jgi:hypothetical protein
MFGRPIDLAAWVKNVGKTKYWASGTDLTAALGSAALVPGAPRTFGVDLIWRFGS